MSRSPRLHFLCLIFCGLLWSQFSYASNTSIVTIPESFELEVKVRMKQMNCIVTPRLNEEVKFYLGKYIFKHPSFTAKMLGNAALYFPIFENLLQQKGMPAELKALSILESWLDPAATSRVGAGGLWQLMPQTAKMYGLEVGKQVDERRDLYKSTEAALTLLKNL
jgi:membrane-bound lytic murein transglycosylase D